jgi:hypothetical protein
MVTRVSFLIASFGNYLRKRHNIELEDRYRDLKDEKITLN